MTKLIPPYEAPPKHGSQSSPTNWRWTAIGVVVGAIIGAAAYVLGGSPWWWLAVPFGAALGASKLEPPVLWGK